MTLSKLDLRTACLGTIWYKHLRQTSPEWLWSQWVTFNLAVPKLIWGPSSRIALSGKWLTSRTSLRAQALRIRLPARPTIQTLPLLPMPLPTSAVSCLDRPRRRGTQWLLQSWTRSRLLRQVGSSCKYQLKERLLSLQERWLTPYRLMICSRRIWVRRSTW